MKKIGFIDYFLDEWHAQMYPDWISKASSGEMKVTYAYAKVDAPNGVDNATWCKERGIELLASIEEVVEKSDYLIVLSPDNPEHHEDLAMLPLQSEKPTYVDKTFAPDLKTAKLLLETARRSGTPVYSTSALRFPEEYVALEKNGIDSICSIGPGIYDNYSIHQIEPIVSLMGTEAERVMSIGTEKSPSLLIEFSGGRQASIRHYTNSPFTLAVNYTEGNSVMVKAESDFFAEFTRNMVRFFETGEPSVNPEETLVIMSIIEQGFKAMKTPYQWVELPR